MNKQQKFTQIYFNEADPTMEITTHNTDLKKRLKRFAEENGVIVKYENLKAHIRAFHDRAALKSNFLFAFHSPRALTEHLAEAQEALEKLRVRIRR